MAIRKNLNYVQTLIILITQLPQEFQSSEIEDYWVKLLKCPLSLCRCIVALHRDERRASGGLVAAGPAPLRWVSVWCVFLCVPASPTAVSIQTLKPWNRRPKKNFSSSHLGFLSSSRIQAPEWTQSQLGLQLNKQLIQYELQSTECQEFVDLGVEEIGRQF